MYATKLPTGRADQVAWGGGGGGGHGRPAASSWRKRLWLVAKTRRPGSRSFLRFSKAGGAGRGGPSQRRPARAGGGSCPWVRGRCGWQDGPRPPSSAFQAGGASPTHFGPRSPTGASGGVGEALSQVRPIPGGAALSRGRQGLLTAQQQLQVRVAHHLAQGPAVVAGGITCGRGGHAGGQGSPVGGLPSPVGAQTHSCPSKPPLFLASGPWRPGAVVWPVLGGGPGAQAGQAAGPHARAPRAPRKSAAQVLMRWLQLCR